VLQALHANGQLQAPVQLARLMIFGALNWSVQWYQAPTPQANSTAVKRSAKTAPPTTQISTPRASLDDLTDAALALFLRDPK